ncbi:MAG TPA: lipocalin-like domain-containing protein, partial [Prosthecobacter sp.]|nr:lipocalin-like domain-containing protein [Prosthecobacter sp.]
IRASTRRLSVSVAALAVSLALTVAIAVMVGSFRQTVLLWVDQSMGADLYVRPGTPARSQGAPTLSQQTLDLLTGHPAVAAADGYRALDLPYQGRIVKLGTGDFAVQVEHGRMVFKTPGDPKALLQRAREKGQVFISESFALRFGVREGGSVELATPQGPRTFTVAGQFYDYSSDGGTLTLDQALFEKHFGASRPTHLALYLKPGSDAGAVREEMLASLDGRGFVSVFTNAGLRAEVLRIFDGTFAITWALEIIAVLVAMAGVAATMLTLVLERREELRLLRLAGAEAGQVRRTILIESGLIGAVSQALGLVVGALLSLVLIHVINPQSFGWSIQFHTPWAFLLGSTVLTVLCTMLAGLWPARRAVKKLALGGMAVLLLSGNAQAASTPAPMSNRAVWEPLGTKPTSFVTAKEPFETCQKPFGTGQKAFETCQKPFGTGQKAFVACQKPFGTGQKAFVTCQKPFGTGQKAFVTCQKPFGTHQKLFGTGSEPRQNLQESPPEAAPAPESGFEQAGGGPAAPPAAPPWQPAQPGYRYEFPRDHAQHPRHKIEWWYFTGNLDTREGRRFGYQLTFFRIGAVAQPAVQSPWALRDVWMAHLAVTDAQGRAYHHADRLNRTGPGLAGSTQERVWNEDWQCLFEPGGMRLRAAEGAFGLELELEKAKPPVFHGRDGISQKGPTPGNASHYYSFTRLPTRGTVTMDGARHEVAGLSWMDHEFGSSFLEKGTTGWDWFSAQLDDGSELMLFQLRGENGGATTGSAGTFIHPDGSAEALAADDLRLTPGQMWRSPAGARYPTGWSLEVPRLGLRLESYAVLPQQEFQAAATPGLGYWEGAVDYRGTRAGKAVRGRGYLEMTGYSGRSMSLWFGGDGE